MAKIRQARRCAAHRTDGRPCGGYAIVGGFICRAHGGAAPQVRAAARDRLCWDDMQRAMVAGVAAHTRAVRDWQVRRVVAAAAASGEDPVILVQRPALLAGVEVLYGLSRPPKPEPRLDGRFRVARWTCLDGRV